MTDFGKNGCKVLRRLTLGDGTTIDPGMFLSAEKTASWPIANKRALEDTGYVQWVKAVDHSELIETIAKLEAENKELREQVEVASNITPRKRKASYDI